MIDPTPLKHYSVKQFPLQPDVIVEKDTSIEMSDGTTLKANIYRPQQQKAPVIVCFTPYGKDLPPDKYTVELDKFCDHGLWAGPLELCSETSFEAPCPSYWTKAGYALVVVDARGYFKSEGRPDVFSDRDIEDFREIIAWCGNRHWSTGKVAVSGVSYLAIIQWYIAENAPKELAAIIPWEGGTDPLSDYILHGGIPETSFSRFWYLLMRKGAKGFSLTLNPFSHFISRLAPSISKNFVRPAKLERIKVPALICTSWSDHGIHSRGSLQGFERISSEFKWLYTHGRKKWLTYYDSEVIELQKKFLDHFLKGEDNGMREVPRARIEIRDSLRKYQVRNSETWPPSDIKYQNFYLNGTQHSLSSAPPADRSKTTYNTEDGSHISYRLKFKKNIDVIGHSSLALWIELSSAYDTDIFITIKKISKGGEYVHFEQGGGETGPVTVGWLRASHSELNKELSRPYRPVSDLSKKSKIIPGKPVCVNIEIMPHATHFNAGEELELIISGRDLSAPSNARFGPGIKHSKTINNGTCTVHTGGNYNSVLLLPIADE